VGKNVPGRPGSVAVEPGTPLSYPLNVNASRLVVAIAIQTSAEHVPGQRGYSLIFNVP